MATKRSQVRKRVGRRALYLVQRHRCALCEKPRLLEDMERHHLVPLGLGGEDRKGNDALLCRPCHRLIHRGSTSQVRVDPELTALASMNVLRWRLEAELERLADLF